jgi:hypothetical protein
VSMGKYISASSGAVFALGVLSAPAFASGAPSGAVTVFGGVAKDSRPLGARNDNLSVGVLPSLGTTVGGATIQVDGLLASHRKEKVLGGGLHAGFGFGSSGFVGVYGAYAHNDVFGGLNTWRLGGEVATDLGPVRFSGVAGYERVRRRSGVVGVNATTIFIDSYGHKSAFFDIVDFRLKAGDKVAVSVGHRYIGKTHAAAAGIELNATDRLTLFAQGRTGGRDYDAAWLGVRFRFGGGTGNGTGGDQLNNHMLEELFSGSNTRRRGTLAVPPPPPPPGGGGSCGGSCGGYSG